MATEGAVALRLLPEHAGFPRLVAEAAMCRGEAPPWGQDEEDVEEDEAALSNHPGVDVAPGVPVGIVVATWVERERQTCLTNRIQNDARRPISRTGGRSQSLSSRYSKGATTPVTTTATTPWSSPKIPTGSSGSRRHTSSPIKRYLATIRERKKKSPKVN